MQNGHRQQQQHRLYRLFAKSMVISIRGGGGGAVWWGHGPLELKLDEARAFELFKEHKESLGLLFLFFFGHLGYDTHPG